MIRSFGIAVLSLVALLPSVSFGGLIISLQDGADLAALQVSNLALYNQVRGGFVNAAGRWSSIFSDDVTVNVSINYRALGPTVLGQAGSSQTVVSYQAFRTALLGDSTSASDLAATSALPNTASFNMRTNDRTGAVIHDTNGSGNNSFLAINTANAKALGLLAANAPAADASITFSSNFGFDFDPTNGITGGQFDFVAIAAHEIGHALGFVSGVDDVDFLSGPNGSGRNNDLNGGAAGIGDLEGFAVFNSLDMFRYSADSLALGAGTLDLAYGGDSYFSLNGGATNLGRFSTGSFNGDGRQASHWKDNLGLGLLDPTIGSGEIGTISALDIMALDVIGWNLTAVPEPSSGLLLAGFATCWWARRRFRKAKSP